MLHASLQVAQILDMFEVRAVITEFQAGEDPTIWTSSPMPLVLPGDWEQDDALSTILRLIALWSERTIHP